MDYTYPGDPCVVVRNAEILGTGNSRGEAHKDRWTEITIVGTDTGYVVAGVGRSLVPGESDRHWMASYASARELVRGLMRPDGRGGKFMPAYARAALREAAEVDLDVEETLEQFSEALAWGEA